MENLPISIGSKLDNIISINKKLERVTEPGEFKIFFDHLTAKFYVKWQNLPFQTIPRKSHGALRLRVSEM